MKSVSNIINNHHSGLMSLFEMIISQQVEPLLRGYVLIHVSPGGILNLCEMIENELGKVIK